MDSYKSTPRMRGGAVVVANDLTHLFPYQSRTALTSTAILDELDKTKNYKHGSNKSENTVLEDMGFRLESKEFHGEKGSGWDAADFHPLLVARDSSTLKEDVCWEKKKTL